MAERRIRTAGRPSYSRPLPRRQAPRRTLTVRLSSLQLRMLWLVVGVIILTLGLRQVFRIHTITVLPASARQELTPQIKQAIDGSWSLGNNLTFGGGTFAAKLKAANPAIKSVTTSRELPGGLRVTVVFKQPSVGWITGNESYVLDADGSVIGAMPTGSKLPTVTDDSNLPVKSGQVVVAARFVSFVTATSDQIPNTGLSITKYEIKDTTYDLYATTNKGYQLIFDTSRQVSGEVGDLTAVLRTLKASGKTPGQYIDLRIAGRAYYK